MNVYLEGLTFRAWIGLRIQVRKLARNTLALCAAWLGCHHPEPEAATPLPKVRVTAAARGPADRTVPLIGLLAAAPGRDVKLGALVAGRLSRVLVAEGDVVGQGQVLAEIEGGPAADELAQAEASAKEAEALALAATARRKRVDDLFRQGAASEQDAERARAEDVSAKSAEVRAKATVDMAERKLSKTAIKAPFDGVVVAVLVRAGEAVDGNGQPVVEVAAPDPIELRAAVVPKDAALLHAGMAAKVRVDTLGVDREGAVFAVAPLADPATGNVLVRVRLSNADHVLKLGVLARGSVVASHQDDAVSVPRSSLVPGPDGGIALMVVQDGVAHQTEVEPAFYLGDRVVLAGGLDGGEQVIAEGGYALPEGAKVEVVR